MATTVTPYNFRRPDRITKEQMHAVQMLHDRFARNISTSLSGYFRAMTEFRVTGVEQMSHSEFVTVLSDPTAFYALAIPPFDELGALEISPALAFTMIDRMLGGSGSEVEHGRPLTEIEQHIVDSIVRLMLEALNEIWRPVADMAFGIRGRETRPQMLQVAAHNDTVVLVTFEMTIGARAGAINLLLPASIVELTSAQFAQVWARPHREAAPIERANDSASLVSRALHERLKRVVARLPGYADRLLETRFARTFWSDAERAGLRDDWARIADSAATT